MGKNSARDPQNANAQQKALLIGNSSPSIKASGSLHNPLANNNLKNDSAQNANSNSQYDPLKKSVGQSTLQLELQNKKLSEQNSMLK